MEGQIIQICNKLFFTFLLNFFLFFGNVTFLKAKENQLSFIKKLESNESISGNYLSWVFSQKYGDANFSNIFLSKLSDSFNSKESVFNGLNSSLLTNDWEACVKFAKKVIKFEKNNFFANLVLSVDSFNRKKFNDSADFISKINKTDIDDVFLEIMNAWISYANGEINDSKDYLGSTEFCIPVKCLHLGLINEFLNNTKQSREIYSGMLSEYDSSIRLYEIFYAFFKKTGDKNKINEIYDKLDVVEKNFNKKKLYEVITPKDALAESYFNISGWFYERKLYKFSVYFGNIGLNLRKNFPALRSLLANSYKKLDLFEYAIKNLDKIDDNSLYYNAQIITHVEILDETGQTDDLIDLLKEASTKTRNNFVDMLLADSLRSAGFYKESIKIYNDLINKIDQPQGDDWGLFYSRGIAFERLKKWDNAEKDFLIALDLRPNEPYVLNYLGYSWLERKINLNEALDIILIAANQKPHDAYIIDSLGWAYFLLGQFSSSIEILEKAVSLSPNDATLNDHLGDAYWKAGRTREAISQWKRVLIFDPKFIRKNEIKKKIATGI